MHHIVPKKNLLLFSVSIALVTILIYFTSQFLVQKEMNKVKNAHEDVESVLYRKERINALEVLVANNQDQINKLREFFIKKGDEVRFIEHIESIAKESGVDFEIGTIDFKQDDSDSISEDVLVKINLKGGWRGLTMFVDRLEKSYFGVLIQEVDINSSSVGSWFGSVTFKLYREK
jgi:hypothetical protein